MKEFDEWFEKTMQPQKERGQTIYKCDCEKTWKAALKWVLKHELIDDDGRFVESYFIREELSEE